jgi:hypothetical protein
VVIETADDDVVTPYTNALLPVPAGLRLGGTNLR